MSEKIKKELVSGEKILYSHYSDKKINSLKKKTAAIILYSIEAAILIPLYFILSPFINNAFSDIELPMRIVLDVLIVGLFAFTPIVTFFIYLNDSQYFKKEGHEIWITTQRIISTYGYGIDIKHEKIVYFKFKRGLLDKIYGYFTISFPTAFNSTCNEVINIPCSEFVEIRNLLVKLFAKYDWEGVK